MNPSRKQADGRSVKPRPLHQTKDTERPDPIVRRYQRRACDLPCTVSIEGPSREAVQPARSLWPTGQIPGRIKDLSPGGAGIRLPIFLPKRTLIRLRVAAPGASITHAGEIDDLLFETLCRVQRIEMIDRTPGYEIGVAFERSDGTPAIDVESILAAIDRAETPHV